MKKVLLSKNNYKAIKKIDFDNYSNYETIKEYLLKCYYKQEKELYMEIITYEEGENYLHYNSSLKERRVGYTIHLVPVENEKNYTLCRRNKEPGFCMRINFKELEEVYKFTKEICDCVGGKILEIITYQLEKSDKTNIINKLNSIQQRILKEWSVML